MYNIIVTDDEGYSSLIFKSKDLDEAKTKIAFLVEACRTPNILIRSPVYESIRLEKSELISEFKIGN